MAKVYSWFSKDRTEALTDGIFATVMTILVLSLVVPTISGPNESATLQADLYRLIPDFFAYIITFIFLGLLWISHQNMFSHIERVDLRTVWINILGSRRCLQFLRATRVIHRKQEARENTIGREKSFYTIF